MVLTLEQLQDASALLPTDERADLADFFLQTLESQESRDEAWRKECTRRLEELHSGKVAGIPAEEVLAQLRKRYP